MVSCKSPQPICGDITGPGLVPGLPLVRYHQPGNVRELQNIIDRALVLAKGPLLDIELETDESTTGSSTVHVQKRLHEGFRFFQNHAPLPQPVQQPESIRIHEVDAGEVEMRR